MKIADLRKAEYNPRTITDRQLQMLGKAMKRFGDLSGIVFNRKTGNVVGGHQRIKHLDASWEIVKQPVNDSVGTVAIGHIKTPFGSWQYREVEWDDKTERAANIAANKHGGDFDIPKLKEILVELDDGEFDVSLTGFDLDELQGLIDHNGNSGLTEDDSVPAIPQVAKTKPGDVWILGDHRVMCGDSTRVADVSVLLGGGQADMLLTDPPYGVSYVGKTKDALTIQNDNINEGQLSELIKKAFDLAQSNCRGGAYWYATVPAGPLHTLFAEDWKKRGVLRQIMVWVKDSMVLGHSEYHYKHEPILFGWTEGDRHKNADRTRTTVWEHARPKASPEHPTMKPVELWMHAVLDGSRNGEIVYDPFLGSGTTVVACEQLNRKCYGIEISPVYCDVIVERWEKFTGKKARRENA